MSSCRSDMDQDEDEGGTFSMVESNKVMVQYGDEDGDHVMEQPEDENIAPLQPLANNSIDLNLPLSNTNHLNMPAPEVAKEHIVAATEEMLENDMDTHEDLTINFFQLSLQTPNISPHSTRTRAQYDHLNMPAPEVAKEHNLAATEEILENDMDANEDLITDNFLQLSLQTPDISPCRTTMARDRDKVAAHLVPGSNMNQDGDNDFLKLSLQTRTTISSGKRKMAQHNGAAHLIEESNRSQDGDKSGANLIEGINRAQDGGKTGTHLIEGSNMVQHRDVAEEEETIDLALRLAIVYVAEEHNIVATTDAAGHDSETDENASADNMDVSKEAPDDGRDANGEILEDEMDAKEEISEAEMDESGESMVINADSPREVVEPDTRSYMGTC